MAQPGRVDFRIRQGWLGVESPLRWALVVLQLYLVVAKLQLGADRQYNTARAPSCVEGEATSRREASLPVTARPLLSSGHPELSIEAARGDVRASNLEPARHSDEPERSTVAHLDVEVGEGASFEKRPQLIGLVQQEHATVDHVHHDPVEVEDP
jgi:hypothetical protein